jgi:membrane-bound metal-dependent hydrolase YbcI (DUF457 family)
MSTRTRRQTAGLVIAGLLLISMVPSVLIPTPEGEEGPPFVVAWRGHRGAMRVIAAALIINAILTLPAFFVDIPAGLLALAGFSVLVTVVAVALMLAPQRAALPASEALR